MGSLLIVLFQVSLCFTSMQIVVAGGLGSPFNYIPSGKVSEEEMFKEMPHQDDEAPTTPATVEVGPHPPPATYMPPPPPSPQQLSFLQSHLAFFPSPDDDGTYLRIDMDEDPSVMPFSVFSSDVGVGPRAATLVMSIPGFSFGTHKARENEVKFYLFTKKVKGDNGIELFSSKKNSENVKDYWFEGADVKILCHGFQSSSEKPFPRLMMKSYLGLEKDLNVILVDWSSLAKSIMYFTVAKETTGVGERVANLIKSLINEGLTTLERVHFIGHSLGAHVGGATGYTLAQSKVGKLYRITGLDPAGPGFCNDEIGQLQVTDAHFVDVIHTDDSAYCEGKMAWILNYDKGKWGSDVTKGHSNFFPNGGHKQPGCGTGVTDTCSHSRAYYYMEESYNDTVSSSTVFHGCPCASYKDYLAGNCACSSDTYVLMGEYTPINRTEEKYFLRTGNKYPYSRVVG